MPILNVKYLITEEEVLNLCSGVYTRSGSALKNNLDASKIFKHMKEIGWDIEKDKTLKQMSVPAKSFSWILNFIKTPAGIVVAIILSVITIGAFVFYLVNKKKKQKEAEMQVAYHNLNKAILKYIGEITEGKVSKKTIDSVISASNKLIEMKNSKKYKVKFDETQINTLLDICKKYTFNLAEEKGVELNPPKTKRDIDCKIILLSWYLNQQKDIIKTV